MSELRNVHTTSIHIDTNIFLDTTSEILLKHKENYELKMAAMCSSDRDPRFHKLMQTLAEYSTTAILNARPFGFSYTEYGACLQDDKKSEVTEYKLKLK